MFGDQGTYTCPSRTGGLESEPEALNLISPGERTGAKLFWQQYATRSEISGYQKLREELGDSFVDSLIARRLRLIWGKGNQEGMVETYFEVSSAVHTIAKGMAKNRLYRGPMYSQTTTQSLKDKYSVTHMSFYCAKMCGRAGTVYDCCNTTKAQTFCSLFMWGCLGRLGRHTFGAQILVALLGGVRIGKSVILGFVQMFIPACLLTSSGSGTSSKLARLKADMNKACFTGDKKTTQTKSICSARFCRPGSASMQDWKGIL